MFVNECCKLLLFIMLREANFVLGFVAASHILDAPIGLIKIGHSLKNIHGLRQTKRHPIHSLQ